MPENFTRPARCGTVFDCTLRPAEAGPMPMRRILIVSDDPFSGELIRAALDGLRAEVRCVADMSAMERMCRHAAFDLVVVSGAGGLMASARPLAALRSGGLQRPLVYVVSWLQSEQTVLGLLEEGGDQYLTFPVSLRRLRAKVETGLARRCV